MKFLMSKVTYETYFIENTRLQGWGCLEHAIRMSQRQISEDLGMQDWSACRMQIYIENYLPYIVSAYFILGERYIFLKSFEGFAVKVLCQKVVLMIQNVGKWLIINYNPACFPCCMHFNFHTAACSNVQDNFSQSGTQLLIPNKISHSSMLWQNYFITFAIISTYFLFKSVCNRNKMLMKNKSKIFKVFYIF